MRGARYHKDMRSRRVGVVIVALLGAGAACGRDAAPPAAAGAWPRVSSGATIAAPAGFRAVRADVLRARSRTQTTEVDASGLTITTRSGVRAHFGAVGAPFVADAAGGVTRTVDACTRERVWTVDAGVDHALSLSCAPKSEGEFTWRIPVDEHDAPFRGVDARGAHFGPREGGIFVSHAAWVDARGRTTHVPIQFHGGALEVRVPAVTVKDSAYPVVLDPVIGAEHSFAPFDKQFPLESGLPLLARGWTSYFAMVGTSVLEGALVRISDNQIIQQPRKLFPPSFRPEYDGPGWITFDGSRFIGALSGYPSSLSLFAVPEAGGAAVSMLTADTYASPTPALFDGTNTVLFHVSSGLAGTANLFPFDKDLAALSPIVVRSSDVTSVSLGFGAGVVLVAYTTTAGDAFVERRAPGTYTLLDAPTKIASSAAIAAGTSFLGRVMPFDGKRFFVSIYDGTSRWVRVKAADGTALDATPISLVQGAPDPSLTTVVVAEGQLGAFTFEAGKTTLVRYDSTTLAPLDSAPLAVADGPARAVIGAGDEYALVVGPELVRVAAATGTVIGAPAVFKQPHTQTAPSLAFGPRGGLLTFDQYDRRVGSVDSDGTLRGALVDDVDTRPSLAGYDGASLFVAGDHAMRRYTAAGAPLDVTPTVVDAAEHPRPLAAVAGTAGVSLLLSSEVVARRVQAGTLLDPTALIGPVSETPLGIAVDGDTFDVISGTYSGDLRLRRIHAFSGAVSSAIALGSSRSVGVNTGRAFASVGPAALDIAVQWESQLRRYRAVDGAPLGTIALSGTIALAAFDARSVLIYGSGQRFWRVRRADGALLAPAAGFDASSLVPPMELASSGDGRFVVAGLRAADYDGSVIYTQSVTFAPNGASCVDDGECVSTYCIASVCGEPAFDAGVPEGTDASSTDRSAAADAASPAPDAAAPSTDASPSEPRIPDDASQPPSASAVAGAPSPSISPAGGCASSPGRAAGLDGLALVALAVTRFRRRRGQASNNSG